MMIHSLLSFYSWKENQQRLKFVGVDFVSSWHVVTSIRPAGSEMIQHDTLIGMFRVTDRNEFTFPVKSHTVWKGLVNSSKKILC